MYEPYNLSKSKRIYSENNMSQQSKFPSIQNNRGIYQE